MKESLSVFSLFLPGIVAGMILAEVVLGVGDAMFPDAFEKLVPRETLLLLGVALVAASLVGFVSLLLPPREEEKSQKSVSSNFPSGGPDVL